ncbi:hypothetical protein PUN28_000385 [Cardiocondyla obscurior]|uniref:Uncharacterized protein n=1 Tax=Cardiocondyla obscurior TaxID=286306 RepID=A0AAW2GZ91_9HYME
MNYTLIELKCKGVTQCDSRVAFSIRIVARDTILQMSGCVNAGDVYVYVCVFENSVVPTKHVFARLSQTCASLADFSSLLASHSVRSILRERKLTRLILQLCTFLLDQSISQSKS